MMLLAEVQKVLTSLGQLGPRRLWQLGLVGVGVRAGLQAMHAVKGRLQPRRGPCGATN